VSTFRLHVEEDFRSRDVRLFVEHKSDMGGRSVLVGLMFDEYSPEREVDGRLLPYEDSQRQFLQAIVDGAWEAGFRPSGYGDVKESLSAKDAHLQDMRALAFHATGVTPPEKPRG
jgi:hypothetical protein